MPQGVAEGHVHRKGVCATCKFYRTICQSHPYGSTTATEELADCISEQEFPESDEDDLWGLDENHPCPNWELQVFHCARHGDWEAYDYCPSCEAEMSNLDAERYDPDFAGDET